MAGGFQGGGGERPRIHAAFFQINCRQIYGAERGLEFVQRRGKRTVGGQAGVIAKVFRRGKKNRALVAQIDIHAGFILQFMHELGIHACAGGGEWLKHGGISSGKSASMPAAAWDASRPGSPRSTIRTVAPRLRSAMESERPMIPPPMMMTSHVFTFRL